MPEQLTRFSRFAAKNPFRQQVTVTPTSSTGTPTTTTPAPKPTPNPTTKPAPVKKPAPITISVTKTPVVPVGPRVPAALVLIDGKKHVLPLEQPFPQVHPLFKVVAISEQAVWIQLVDGSLAGGQQTVKIDRGRKVTLENATAGLKMALRLLKPTTAPKPSTPPSTAKPSQVVIAPPPAPPTTTTGG